jgi:hypothetical protein
MQLEKYSMGVGDRFAHQGKAQLQAFVQAKEAGIAVTPVWNKSNREHIIIHTHPDDVRMEADTAVQSLSWQNAYHVDADHIGLDTVDRFIPGCDFFTLDVADFTGKQAPEKDIQEFVQSHAHLAGAIQLPGIETPLQITTEQIQRTAERYLLAVQEAGKIYRYIAARRTPDRFITEVSMDETNTPQTPDELLVILAALAAEKIPAQTIAPKFTGRFNKGVDYVGDPQAFALEFASDTAVIQYAIHHFDLPENLKLSVHSGSDKFAIYPIINEVIKKFNSGLHLKTAGTTWLEEVIGLAQAEGEGLSVAKEIYARSYERFDELCNPYATVIDIEPSMLPAPAVVQEWDGIQFANALRHDQNCPDYNPHMRQLIHVGYKVAGEMGPVYLSALEACSDTIAEGVTFNILERHIKPIFG